MRHRSLVCRVACFFTLISMVAICPLFAQTAGTGALTGTITDSTGAAVPNVTVTAISTATGQERTATTGTDGVYRFTLLPPGAYRVRFAAAGFKTAEVGPIDIVVTETAELNRSLEVGQQSEQITVEANVETIQTASSALGTTVNSQTVTALPLTTRNYTQILTLSAGVNVGVNNAGAIGNGSVDVAVNGARTAQNNYSMDGVSITPFGNGSVTNDGVYAGFGVPNPDAIQEFKIQTSLYDAGFGRNIGANVNVVTKSGSNAFHGSMFEFVRNTVFNANDFFRNRYCGQNPANCQGNVKPPLNQNQFGGVLGGPLKKDKLFFFVSYQGTRQKNGLAQQGLSTVNIPYLPADRSNKAALRAALGAAYGGKSGALGGVRIAPDGSNISDVALNILQLKLANGQYYMPGFSNLAQASVNNANNITLNGVAFVNPATFNENQVLVNGDYIINAKHTLATRYYYQPQDQHNNFAAVGQAPGSVQNIERRNINGVVKLTSLVSNTMVNEAYASVARAVQDIFAFPTPDGTTPFKATAVGIKPINAHTDILEPLLIAGVYNAGATCCTSSWMATNEYQVGDQLSWTKGRHSLRMGAGYHHVIWPWTFSGFSRGELNFRSFADFLLGKSGCTPGDTACLNSIDRNGNVVNAAALGNTNGTPVSNIFNCTLCLVTSPGGVVHDYRINNGFAFIQDDFKVNSRLTLNLGVRWEYIGQAVDKNGDLSNTWLSRALAGNALVGTNQANGTYMGWVVPSNYQKDAQFPLTGQYATIFRNGLKNASRNGSPLDNFAPRFGFAWTPIGGSRFVVRGGVGIFYDTPNGNARIHSVNENPPYTVKQDRSGADNYFSNLAEPYAYAPLGWGNSRWVNFQTGASSAIITPLLTEIFHTPTVYQYNLSVQYEFVPTMVLEVGYVGNKGIRLANQLRQLNTAAIASPDHPVCYQTLTGNNCVTTSTVSNVNVRVPYLGYSSVGVQQEGYDGDSRFNSLQVTLRKRMSRGLTFQGSYTLSSLFTNLSVNNTANSNNPTDLRQQWGRSTIYRPNRFTVNYSWDIPVGRVGDKGLGRALLSGWSLSGVTTIQDGQPMTVIDNRGGTVFSSLQAFGSTINPRAQMAPGATYADVATSGSDSERVGLDPGSKRFMNIAAFTAPQFVTPNGAILPVGTPASACPGCATIYGNSGVAIIQGPGQLNFDTSLIKNTKVGGINEDAMLQFRAEFYNLFNHTQFNTPAVGGPNMRVDLPGSFGQLTSTSVAPRLIQFALKYTF
jgi:hypothetical protein